MASSPAAALSLGSGGDDTSSHSRLLERRRQVFEVEEALFAQKDEYARREDTFRRREEALRRKDVELQETLARFNNVISENESKRARAEKKALEDRAAASAKEEEVAGSLVQLVTLREASCPPSACAVPFLSSATTTRRMCVHACTRARRNNCCGCSGANKSQMKPRGKSYRLRHSGNAACEHVPLSLSLSLSLSRARARLCYLSLSLSLSLSRHIMLPVLLPSHPPLARLRCDTTARPTTRAYLRCTTCSCVP